MCRWIVLDQVFVIVIMGNDFCDPDIVRQVGEFAEMFLSGTGCHGETSLMSGMSVKRVC